MKHNNLIMNNQYFTVGSYILNINTQFCNLRSGALNYTVTPCEKCGIEVRVASITPTNTTLCSYTVNLIVFNGSGGILPITFTNPADAVIVTPTSFTLNVGTNNIQIVVTPIVTFNGGVVNLIINGLDVKNNRRCTTDLALTLPSCSSITSKTANSAKEISLLIAPNPSEDETIITFVSTTTAPKIEVYSILGKLISNYEATTLTGKWELNTSNLTSGIYVVVMRINEEIISQQKLIIN